MPTTPQEQRSMRASVALTAASRIGTADETPEVTLKRAQDYYDWLVATGGEQVTAAQGAQNVEKAFDAKPAGDTCPECGVGQVVQKTKRDKSGTFMGCNNYPNCKYIRKGS